ncbi:MAG: hypothetical protein MJ239_01080 [Bacilli bacterium]|nr:hypothetical protein [Bacilli bacterium]
MESKEYFENHFTQRYERHGFDKFVKDVRLSLNVPCIHVTGTNGKGAFVKFLSDIYRHNGKKVGTFTSPYFYDFNEMIKIDGEEISDDDMERIFLSEKKKITKYELSPFEAQVYIAYRYFNEKKPDLVIIECGMGGAMDATNIRGLEPLLSVITSVSLEHTELLGRSVSEIALSKGGIVKEYRPLLVGKLDENAKTTLEDLCRSLESPFHEVEGYYFEKSDSAGWSFDYRPYKSLYVPCLAKYQVSNACLAVEATKILSQTFPVSEEDVREGLSEETPILHLESIGNIILDGAHNPEAISALVQDMPTWSEGKPVHVLFASFRDKNIAIEFPVLAKDTASITLTTFDHPRAREQMDYFLYEEDFHYEEDFKKALNDLMTQYPEDIILVCGSLAFASIVRRYLKEGRSL